MTARLQLEEQVLDFQQDTITIGRDSDLFKICDYTVSRQHFSLCRERDIDAYRIYDLKSLSGTWVDNILVPEQGLILPDFAQIRCGNCIFSYYYLGSIVWDSTPMICQQLNLNIEQMSESAGKITAFLYHIAIFFQENSWSSDYMKMQVLQLICQYLVIDIAILIAVPVLDTYQIKMAVRSSLQISLSNMQISRQLLANCIARRTPLYTTNRQRKILCMPIMVQSSGHILYLERSQPFDFTNDEIMALATTVQLIILNDQMQKFSERAVQVQKLETIGMTAAGIVHSLNNLLSCFSAHLEELATQLQSNNIVVGNECITNLHKTLQDATSLTQGIMNLVKGKKASKTLINLANLLKNIQKLFRASLPANISFEVVIHNTDISIQGTASDLSQAILNLLRNAKDAMPNGGSLKISTTIDEQYIKIIIQDTGVGMDATVLKKIFTPFFTTKSLEGHGLGLYHTLSIIQQHGGKMEVTSIPNQGSNFYIYLPLASENEDNSTKKLH